MFNRVECVDIFQYFIQKQFLLTETPFNLYKTPAKMPLHRYDHKNEIFLPGNLFFVIFCSVIESLPENLGRKIHFILCMWVYLYER